MKPTDTEIADRLRAILQSDEFRPRASEKLWLWIGEALDTLKQWLEQLSPELRVLVIVVCIVVLVAIGVHLWQSLREVVAPRRMRMSHGSAREQTLPAPEMLLERARSLADEGLLRDAARALQQALLVQACRDHNIPWRPSLSDWEWVRILRPSDSVIEFTRTTQRLAFGPEPSRTEFDACAHAVQSLISGQAGISSGAS